MLRQFHGFDQQAALAILDRLTRLAPASLGSFINQMPTDWLPDPTRSIFVDWWSNGGRAERLAALRTGIIGGALL